MKPIYFFTTDITIKAGIERITINLANWFVKQGFSVTVVSNFKTNDLPAYSFDERIKFDYLSKEHFGGMPGSLKRLCLFFNNIKNIRRYFKNVENAIIILQAFPNGFMYWLTSKNKSGNQVYNVEHVEYYYYNKLIRLLRLIIYKKYNNVVVLTKKDKECYERHHINVTLIPNGINLPKNYENKERKNIICAIGRLSPQKKFDVLISVFSRIRKKYPDWKLEIYGKGPLQDELQNQISELNLTNSCFLKGITDDVNSVLQKNSIFVVSSLYEGFSIVLIEAMSNGIACVSFDCPTGPGEIITNDFDGLLVENQNQDLMYEAIENLIQNKEKRLLLGKNAIESAKKYSIENVGKQWLNLFSTQS